MTDAERIRAEAQERNIDFSRLPRHIAVIMDGNGRWAKSRGLPRPLGHYHGYQTIRPIVRAASDLGIEALTLYAFSLDNWKRPLTEVSALMRLFEQATRNEIRELNAHGVRMRFCGRIFELPPSLQDAIHDNEEATSHNTGLRLNLCLNYSGRQEILDATRRLVEMACRHELCEKDVTPELFAEGLYTAGLPDPDLLIRTAGEMRVSDYLLWQIAYTELWVTPDPWPDFTTGHLLSAVSDYQQRTRRFGAVVNS